MEKRISYDDYYNMERDGVYEYKRGVGPMGVFVISFVACGIGYVFGYRKARATAKGILDTVFEKIPDHKEGFRKVWNVAVDEYFEKK